MKKTIYKSMNYSKNEYEEDLTGVLEPARWKLTSYYGNPKEPGEYLVSDGKGIIWTMYCTGDTPAKELFDNIVDGYVYENVTFSDGKELSSDDLIWLYKKYGVWFELYEYYHYEDACTDLKIMRDEDRPKYFMEPKLSGPIDSELDNYEKVFVDVHGNILSNVEESK